MTEEEKMRWFLLRASTVVGDRVQHFDDILEEKFFKALESLFFEKDNPLETEDEEFEKVDTKKIYSIQRHPFYFFGSLTIQVVN